MRGLTATRSSVQAEADAVGPATTQVVSDLLASRPVDKLRTALRVLRLAETYTPARLEAACVRGLAFGDVSLVTLRRILVEKLDILTLPLPVASSPETFVFVRPPEELAQTIGGGVSWK